MRRFEKKILRIENSIRLALRGIMKGATVRSKIYEAAEAKSEEQKAILKQWKEDKTFREKRPLSPLNKIEEILGAAGNDYIFSDWVSDPLGEDQALASRIAIVGHRRAEQGIRTLKEE
jgi:hypothetical protein